MDVKRKIELFSISCNMSLFDALKKINENKMGSLVVVDNGGRVVGTLTDGDIRRYILKKRKINIRVKDVMNKRFIYCDKDVDIHKVLQTFCEEKVKFLPIVDEEMFLYNILFLDEIELLVTTNNEFDPLSLNLYNQIVSKEFITQRPWGFYKTIFKNINTHAKVLVVYPGESTSLQVHRRREERWIIVFGEGLAIIGDSEILIHQGQQLFVPKGVKHRISNTGSDKLMLVEVQLGDYFEEDDIIRLEDKYGRIGGENNEI